MIVYDSGDYHLAFLCRLQGSSFPRAALFSLPSAGLAVLFSYMLRDKDEFDIEFLQQLNQSSVWSASILVVGMLVAFRTNKAYDRFWEGITLVQQMRAEWFEAASNLMAFSEVAAKKDPTNDAMVTEVKDFQLTLIRLMSLMHGAALRQIGGYKEEFPVLDLQGLDEDSLLYLADCEEILSNRVEVLLHWIQVLITDGHTTGVVDVAPPILTRAYQTLSRGMVNLHNARKLADVPFPFPLSQTVVTLIILQSVITPVFASSLVQHEALAAVISFLPIFGMWSVIFIAGQLEQPFGTDPNDLPLSVLQFDMNTSLLMLLEAKRAPTLSKRAFRTVSHLRLSLSNTQLSSTRLDSVNFMFADCQEGDEEEDDDEQVDVIGKSVIEKSVNVEELMGTATDSSITFSSTISDARKRGSTQQRQRPSRFSTRFREPSLAERISNLIPLRGKAQKNRMSRMITSHHEQLKEREERLTDAAKPKRQTRFRVSERDRMSYITHSIGLASGPLTDANPPGSARPPPNKDFGAIEKLGSLPSSPPKTGRAKEVLHEGASVPRMPQSVVRHYVGDSESPRRASGFAGQDEAMSSFPRAAQSSPAPHIVHLDANAAQAMRVSRPVVQALGEALGEADPDEMNKVLSINLRDDHVGSRSVKFSPRLL